MPDRVFTTRQHRVRVVLDSIIVLLLLVAVYQQTQNNEFSDQIKQTQARFADEQKHIDTKFADALTSGCISGNGARLALRNLLISVEAAQATDPTIPPREREQGKKFFDAQIANIHLADCSKYHKATN